MYHHIYNIYNFKIYDFVFNGTAGVYVYSSVFFINDKQSCKYDRKKKKK